MEMKQAHLRSPSLRLRLLLLLQESVRQMEEAHRVQSILHVVRWKMEETRSLPLRGSNTTLKAVRTNQTLLVKQKWLTMLVTEVKACGLLDFLLKLLGRC